MPFLIPIIAAYAASAIATAVVGDIVIASVAGFTLTAAGLAGGIASIAVSALMSPKAKAQKTSGNGGDASYPYLNSGTKTNARNTIAFQEIVYGQIRKSGVIIYESVSSHGTDNLGNTHSDVSVYLNQLIVFAAHECDSFVSYFLDDNLLTIDSNGWVTSAAYTKNTDTFVTKAATSFSGAGDAQTATGSGTSASVKISVAFATANTLIGTGDLVQVAGLSDSAYNGQFVITSIATSNAGASTQINYTTDSTITSTGISQASLTVLVNQIGYRGTTAYMYDSTGHGLVISDNVYTSLASVLVYNIDRAVVTNTPSVRTFTYTVPTTPTNVSISGSYQRRNGTDQYLVRIKSFLGGAGQNIGNDSLIKTLIPGELSTTTDLGTGLCAVFIQFYNAGDFNAQPQLTAEIKGAKCYDPRDSTHAWTNNATLVIMDYLTRTTGTTSKGISLGLNYDNVLNTSTDLDITNFAHAANICAEPVQLLDGTYDTRYTIDGVVSTGDNPIDILSLMVPNIGGFFTYYDWKAKLFAGEYTPPTAYIDQSWFTSSMQLVATNDLQNLSNTVHAIFNDASNKYYSQDIPPYQDATALAEDNNQELQEDLQLPYVKNIEKAQRLAKLYLKQKRATKNQLTVKMSACGATLAPADVVTLNYPRLAIYNQTYKIIGHTEGLLGEGVSVIMRKEDPTYYDWTASEANT